MGEKTITNNLGMTFTHIEPKTFQMGTPENDPIRCEDEQYHRVILTKPYGMQTTTVTVGQWRRFVNETGYQTESEQENGGAWVFTERNSWIFNKVSKRYKWTQPIGASWSDPGFEQTDTHPVTCVSWNDAVAFTDWINQSDDSMTYRLPTEAEWEYACRSDTTTRYHTGDRIFPWQAKYVYFVSKLYLHLPFVSGQSRRPKTATVDAFGPNGFGLYSMSGNVWEWCMDKCEVTPKIQCDTYVDDVVDPLSDIGHYHILRGGSWAYTAFFCRPAYRRAEFAHYRASGIGFRIVAVDKQ